MRIVQLANFHGPRSGGLRVAVDVLRQGYRDAGHECRLVVPGPQNAEADGVHMLRSPRLPNRTGYRVLVRRAAVLRLLDRLRPDLIEVHDKLLQSWVWDFSRAHGVPVVAVSHERLADTVPLLVPFAPRRLAGRVTTAIARRVVEHCDALVVCSQFAAAEFVGRPFTGAPVHVVPLGVDLDTFRPVPAEPGEVTRLVLTGRLSAEKRPELAVETLRELCRRRVAAELTVLGDGPLRAELTRRARGLPVRFAGFRTSRGEVAGALARADIALAPGPAETFGLAALEALACGTPVVAVAGAAPSELLRGHPEAGQASAATATGFADAVLRLIAADPVRRRAAARRCAEGYPWSASVARMLDLHARLAQPTPPARR